MKLRRMAFMALLIGATLTSCENVDDGVVEDPPQVSLGDYDNGILISHEGGFPGGFGTVSYVSNDLNTIENNIFSNVNERALGTVAQSITFDGDLAYIIINASNQIEIVNRYTFKSVATLTNPSFFNLRYMTIENNKGYVTNWGDVSDPSDDKVIIIDLINNTVLGSINTGKIPEEIISNDNKVYVATGSFGGSKTIEIIDATNDNLITSLELASSPNSIRLDNNGDVWVLTPESLYEIDKKTNIISKQLDFEPSIKPSKLYYDNDTFYYFAEGAVYKFQENASELPVEPEFSGVSFYDMSIKDDILYGLDAGSFQENGFMKVYDLNSNTEIKSIELDLIPGEVYFN